MKKSLARWTTRGIEREVAAAYIFLAPALLLLFLFLVMPLLGALYYSLTDYFLLRPNAKKFIGLENYTNLIKDDPLLRKTFLNTLLFVVIVLPVQLGAALGLALIVNREFRGNTLFRTIYFSPAVLSLVVLSLLALVLFNPKSGLINSLLGRVGIPPQPFLTGKNQAMPTIAFISAWQGCAYQMIIILAGLKDIPTELYEAAEIDGARRGRRFLSITVPGLRPIINFLLIVTTIQAFKLIVQPMVMTGGGPENSTITVLQYIYEYGFRHRNIGYASAVTVIFTLFLILFSVFLKRILGEEES